MLSEVVIVDLNNEFLFLQSNIPGNFTEKTDLHVNITSNIQVFKLKAGFFHYINSS